jgi:phage tail sheath protein FI
MAEKIVSPGVFTRENDLSFLQQGVSEIGAAFIGPFKEGPAVPTVVNTQTEFETLFGIVDDTYYTPLAVQNYLREAGTATICRVVGKGGYTAQNPLLINVRSGSDGASATEICSASVGILFPTDKNVLSTGLSGSSATTTNGSLGYGDLTMFVTGSTNYTGTTSVDPEDTNDIESVFGTSPLGAKGGYVYGFFKTPVETTAGKSIVYGATVSSSVVVLGDQDFTFDAQEAKTPYVQSQLISGERYNLFQFETIGVGTSANTRVKVAITNIKAAGTVAGTDYGTFTVVVRDFNDTDKKKVILETYSNVNLDPNSPNYISRVIGDKYISINDSGKITETGDWVNFSKYIRIKNVSTTAPVQAVPFAHAAYQLPVSAGVYANWIPKVTYSTASVDDSTKYSGIDLDGNGDNRIYLKPIPDGAGNGANTAFSLDTTCGLTLSGTTSVDIAKRQFILGFQEGFDGMAPTTPIYKGGDIVAGNSQGFDLSTSTSSGSLAYAKHINALSNADEWDINMVVTPGVVRRLHSSVVTDLIDMVEQRSDCFYIMDGTAQDDSIDQASSQASAVDSNYVGTYYPWVKTIDVNTNKLISVPPSVLLPGVFASNDRVAAEWFAPAGLNRGGLLGAVSVLNRLTHSERDTLYENKVNPIAQFPGQGIVVFGQKTLQDKPSALDRINVRRLLLTVRKYIASTSRYLVFEQNSSETRNRFLNIVNPYLESIQQRQGLYAFRVVMDESNNTPDVIDRNFLKGAIYLQPTKTAEFIQIDFNILPTGAAFNG